MSTESTRSLKENDFEMKDIKALAQQPGAQCDGHLPDVGQAAIARLAADADFCQHLAGDKQRALSDALVADTLRALPAQPDRVSDVQGPFLEVERVDDTSVDINVIHRFRAHFDRRGQASLRIVELKEGEEEDGGQQGGHPQGMPRTTSASSGDSMGKRSNEEGGIFSTDLAHLPGRSPVSEPEERSTEAAAAAATVANAGNAKLSEAAGTLCRWEGQQLRHSSPGPWELDPEQVLLGERLAVGGFAEVFLGKYQGTLVAVKLLVNVDGGVVERFQREVRLLATLRHPNLILFMGYVMRPHLAIVSEFMHRGSLFKLLRKGGNRPLEARLQRSVAVSVARGMGYLHTRNPPVLHLDLKSPNILVDDRWRVKIADFGLSRFRQHTFVSSGAGAGTPEWMAPEVLRNERFDERADVYSYGVVLWECLTGQPPWEHLNPMQVVGAVGFQGASLPLPTTGDPFLIDLCRRCLSPDTHQRPSFLTIVQELEAEYAPWQLASLSTSLSQASISREREPGAGPGLARELPPLLLPAPPGQDGAPVRRSGSSGGSGGPDGNEGGGGGGLGKAGNFSSGGSSAEASALDSGGSQLSSVFAAAGAALGGPGSSIGSISEALRAEGHAEQQQQQWRRRQHVEQEQEQAPGLAVQWETGLHPQHSITNDSPFAQFGVGGVSLG